MTSLFTVRKHDQAVCTTMTSKSLPKHLCMFPEPIYISVSNISICLMSSAPNVGSCQATELGDDSPDSDPICCYSKKNEMVLLKLS